MGMSAINQSKQVVEAILSGQNTKALNYLYKSSLPQIIKYVCMNKGSEDEAKDIFQDAVVSLFTTVKLGKYDIEKDVNGFLFFVSRNLWINYVKKRNRQVELQNLNHTLKEESHLAVIIDEEKKEMIELLFSKLGDRCKQILNLVIYEGLSMKEVAMKMNFASEDVAKSTHYRCKQKMIELVANNEHTKRLFKDYGKDN
ncbi:MAG: sigma-70 family RNA polymerase sigma factor [Cytophagales bacterium]